MSILDNEIYIDELKQAIEQIAPIRDSLINCRITITGATGVIGREIVDILMFDNKTYSSNITIQAVGRSKTKINSVFNEYVGNNNFFAYDYTDMSEGNFISDYVIHCASVTASKLFVEKPIEVLEESFNLTKLTLDYSAKFAKKYIYVSSLEAYGTPRDGQEIFIESDSGYISTTDVRNSYPIAKNMCEMLTTAYQKEKGLFTIIVRLVKAYGLTLTSDDKRVFADFAKKGISGTEIVLHSDGTQKFSYVYVMDVAIAMLYALIKGENNEIYNITDNNSIATISDLADIFATKCCVNVVYDIMPSEATGYAKIKHCVVDANKFLSLGYTPQIDLDTGISRLIDFLRN